MNRTISTVVLTLALAAAAPLSGALAQNEPSKSGGGTAPAPAPDKSTKDAGKKPPAGQKTTDANKNREGGGTGGTGDSAKPPEQAPQRSRIK